MSIVASWKESQGHYRSYRLARPPGDGNNSGREGCSWSVATVACVCTNSGWSTRVLLPGHSPSSALPLGFSPHAILPASALCPCSLTDHLCMGQEEEEYKGLILSIIPTGFIPGNFRGADALFWSKQLSPRAACFCKDCGPGSFSGREQWGQGVD